MPRPRSRDFTLEPDVTAITDAAIKFLGGLNAVVVGSGTSAIGSILTASRAQFEEVGRRLAAAPSGFPSERCRQFAEEGVCVNFYPRLQRR